MTEEPVSPVNERVQELRVMVSLEARSATCRYQVLLAAVLLKTSSSAVRDDPLGLRRPSGCQSPVRVEPDG